MGTRGLDWSEEELLRVLAYYVGQGNRQPNSDEFKLLLEKMSPRTAGTLVFRLLNFVARDEKAAASGEKGKKGGGPKVDDFLNRYKNASGDFDLQKILRDCSTTL